VSDTDPVTDTSSGVAVVVWRRRAELEVLLLHRSLFGEDFSGDWAWTTPGGAREPDESPAAAAERELSEETGLRLACWPVGSAVAEAQREIEVDVFAAEATGDADVRLSGEHDRYEWVRLDDLDRCLPGWVGQMYREVLESASRR
jgi:8-oxo-dGTP pyrophosphatase MutT (NUDIX family)